MLCFVWTLAWGDDQATRDVANAEQLDVLLEDASREATGRPLIVELTSPTGATCGIGLGRDVSVVTFEESLDPPYLISEGDASESGDGPLVFFYGGHWCEFDAAAGVPKPKAMAALREFFHSGTRPRSVQFREV